MYKVMLISTHSKVNYLTKEQIKEQCPVAFEKTPTNPGVSDKYLHVNTETIIDDLEKLGWLPVQASMRKTRGTGTIFSKHMVVFQHPDLMIKGIDGDDSFPRIILTNSHDGYNSFKFSVGIFRLICSNGLVIADKTFSEFKIAHKGYTFEELRKVVVDTVKILPEKVEILNQMKEKVLTQEEKEDLALEALLLRAGVSRYSEEGEKLTKDVEAIEEILTPSREADRGDDLWKVFNTIQEKIIKGGFLSALSGVKVRKVRPITSFEKDLDLNKKLFKAAVEMVN